MKEYLPWSSTVFEKAKQQYINAKMSILDIQLSGSCQYNCVYCDSPDRCKPCTIDFTHLFQLVENSANAGRKFDWVFVCGLGEPLWAENKKNLFRILQMCEHFNMRCSIFTNGNQLDDAILDFVARGTLYPLIKIDTFNPELAAEIYGTTLEGANKTLAATEQLFSLCKNMDSQDYHVGASIVPTTKNIDELKTIVQKCINNNVFPLIGQLEYAGKAVASNEELNLTKEELYEIKAEIEGLYGPYKIPICPSVIAGFHITHNGQISVDRKSGLSCSWFWLEDPDVIDLCNVNSINSFDEVDPLIINYRYSVLENMKQIAPTIEEHPFGGCGGNIRDLANEYVELQQQLNN